MKVHFRLKADPFTTACKVELTDAMEVACAYPKKYNKQADIEHAWTKVTCSDCLKYKPVQSEGE